MMNTTENVVQMSYESSKCCVNFQKATNISIKGALRSFVWGGRIRGHLNQLAPKIPFLLGFRPLYFENVGSCKKIIRVKKKVAEIGTIISGGTSPADLSTAGDAQSIPPPPSSRFRLPRFQCFIM